MNKPGKLYLFCGKMAAGKSTLAKTVAAHQNALLLSEDSLLAGLYPGEVSDIATYVRYSGRIKQTLESHLISLLEHGLSVVLDFPANTVEQRKWLVGLADKANAEHELLFLDIPDAVCKARLAKRAEEQPERRATDTEQMFDAMSGYFVAPQAEEGVEVVVWLGSE